MTQHEFCFPADAVGQRLDKWIAAQGIELTRCAVQGLIASGHVTVGGKPIPKNYRPKAGDQIYLEVPPPEEIEIIPQDIPHRV